MVTRDKLEDLLWKLEITRKSAEGLEKANILKGNLDFIIDDVKEMLGKATS